MDSYFNYVPSRRNARYDMLVIYTLVLTQYANPVILLQYGLELIRLIERNHIIHSTSLDFLQKTIKWRKTFKRPCQNIFDFHIRMPKNQYWIIWSTWLVYFRTMSFLTQISSKKLCVVILGVHEITIVVVLKVPICGFT